MNHFPGSFMGPLSPASISDQGSAVWVFAVNSALTWLRINSDSGYTPLTGLFSRFGIYSYMQCRGFA